MSFYLYSINTGFYINSSGYVGILNSNPQYPIDISGSYRSEKIITNLNSFNEKTLMVGNPIKQDPQSQLFIYGNDMAGRIKLLVHPTELCDFFELKISFKKPYQDKPFVVFSINNANRFTENIDKFYLNIFNDYFSLKKEEYSPSYPYCLTESPTAYIWDYIVVGPDKYLI